MPPDSRSSPEGIIAFNILQMHALVSLRISMQIRDFSICHINLPLVHSDISLIAKYRSNLLQWQTIRIGKEKPNHQSTNCAGNDKNEVELPPNGDESSGRGLQPDNVGEGDCCNAQRNAF
jgi:hypothetical protein